MYFYIRCEKVKPEIEIYLVSAHLHVVGTVQKMPKTETLPRRFDKEFMVQVSKMQMIFSVFFY